MNWTTLCFALAVNTVLCLLQFLFQERDKNRGTIAPRHSKIPGTEQKFLYWQDFYTQAYGDLFGLPFVMNCFLVIFPSLNNWEMLAFAILCILSAIAFFVPRLAKDHKPSWGEPTIGKISSGGYVHSFYFSLLSAMTIVCLWAMVTGKINNDAIILSTIVGIGIWTVTCIMDIVSGNFASLKNQLK